MSVLNLITKGSLLLHTTIKCTYSVWYIYDSRLCEEKTVCNCETSGYSTNTALWKQWLGGKLSTWVKNGLFKDMHIQTYPIKTRINTKKWQRHFTTDNETLILTTKNFLNCTYIAQFSELYIYRTIFWTVHISHNFLNCTYNAQFSELYI